MDNIQETVAFIINGTTHWDRRKESEWTLHALVDLMRYSGEPSQRHENILESCTGALLLASRDFKTVRNIIGATLIAYPSDAPALLDELLRKLIQTCDPRVTNAARLGVILAVFHSMAVLFSSFHNPEDDDTRCRIEEKVVAFLVTLLSHETVKFIPKAVAEAGAISEAVARFVTFPLTGADDGEWTPRLKECGRGITKSISPAREVSSPNCRFVDQVIDELRHRVTF